MVEIHATGQDILEWMKTKPADTKACLDNIGCCIMADYAREVHGFKDPEAGVEMVYSRGDLDIRIAFRHFNFHMIQGAKTYGEAVKKLTRYYIG